MPSAAIALQPTFPRLTIVERTAVIDTAVDEWVWLPDQLYSAVPMLTTDATPLSLATSATTVDLTAVISTAISAKVQFIELLSSATPMLVTAHVPTAATIDWPAVNLTACI